MLSMAEFGKETLHQKQFSIGLFDDEHGFAKKNCWVIMESGDDHDHHHDDHDHSHNDDETYNPTTSSSSIGNSTSSNGSTLSSSSSSSSDLIDDASSSPSSSNSNGPLYELSDLMSQLPIKRGLSKYFQGKSQSFTSLSKVMSLEDLAKKENPYNIRRKMKACKSYAHNLYTLPKATISKKSPRNCVSSLSFSTRRKSAGFLVTNNNKLPQLPLQNNS